MPAVNLLIKPASSLCNMRCRYCFYSDVSDHRCVPSYGMMTLDTLDRIVEKAFAYATGSAGFAFQGGEPTLVGLDFYRTLIRLQKKYNTKGLRVYNSIQTNGLNLDDDWFRFFAEQHFLVGLSMDGTRDVHNTLRPDATGAGTYDAVARTAARLKQFGVDYNILCVVSDPVARHPQKVYHNLKSHGFLQFIPCLDGLDGKPAVYSLTPERYASFLCTTFSLYYQDFMNGRYVSIRNFDNYIQMLLGRPPENCAMNGCCTCYFVVEGDGSVFPCDFYVLDQWKLGNIHTDSLQAMQGSDLARQFVDQSRPIDPACRACRYYPLCRGGCRREREPFSNGQPGLNRLCESHRIFFDTCIDRMEIMAQQLRRQHATPF